MLMFNRFEVYILVVKLDFFLHYPSMSLLKKLLQFLQENSLVLAVGVVERVYVAHEFKQHWVIQSFKNQKGVGVTTTTLETDDELTNPQSSDIQKVFSEESESEKSGRRSTRRLKLPIVDQSSVNNDGELMAKKFKNVCLIPRPWRYIDGLLNRPVLKQMLETIILHLKTYPNSTLDALSAHFSPILQPIMTLELVEMLEQLKCVRKIVLKKETKCDLFSDFNNGSFKFADDENNENIEQNMNGDETFTYYCSQNSIFTVKKVFPD